MRLIGVRAEISSVLAATHVRIETMIRKGEIDGVRVDHPDGLRDPLSYFTRLRELLPDGRIYIEKILENDERLNEEWPIDGTVGYDFLAKVNRLWMDDQRIDVLTATYSDFTGHSVNFGRLVREKKRAIVESAFSDAHQQLAAHGAADRAKRLALAGLEPAAITRSLGQADYGIAHLPHVPDGIIDPRGGQADIGGGAAKRAHRVPGSRRRCV